MRKRIIAAGCALAMLFMLTGCEGSDSPSQMLDRFVETQKNNDTFLNGLARYFTDYNWFWLAREDSLVDVTWEQAKAESEVLAAFPKLVDNIELIELSSSIGLDRVNTIYQKNEDYRKDYDKYVSILSSAGFDCQTGGYDPESGVMVLKYYKETSGGDRLGIDITATKPKHPESYNVTITLTKNFSSFSDIDDLIGELNGLSIEDLEGLL